MLKQQSLVHHFNSKLVRQKFTKSDPRTVHVPLEFAVQTAGKNHTVLTCKRSTNSIQLKFSIRLFVKLKIITIKFNLITVTEYQSFKL